MQLYVAKPANCTKPQIVEQVFGWGTRIGRNKLLPTLYLLPPWHIYFLEIPRFPFGRPRTPIKYNTNAVRQRAVALARPCGTQLAYHISFGQHRSKFAPVLGEFLQLDSQILEGVLAPSPTHVSQQVFVSARSLRCDLFITPYQPSQDQNSKKKSAIAPSTGVGCFR